jgi:hypothetical protein
LRVLTRLGSDRAFMTLMKSLIGRPLETLILPNRNVKDNGSTVKGISLEGTITSIFIIL